MSAAHFALSLSIYKQFIGAFLGSMLLSKPAEDHGKSVVLRETDNKQEEGICKACEHV